MTMNPTDYDVNELRDSPEGTDPLIGGNGSPVQLGGPSGAEEVLESGQYRELFLLQTAMADGTLEKPYLTAIPDAYAAEIMVFEWLEFLLAKAGFKRTLDVLRYYAAIDWLAPEMVDQLRDYLTGLDEASGESSDLNRSDHMLSLVYIARIASMEEES